MKYPVGVLALAVLLGTAAHADDGKCAREGESVARFLAPLLPGDPGFAVEASLLVAGDGRAPTIGPLITWRDDRITLDGRPLMGIVDAGEALQQLYNLRSLLHPNDHSAPVVAIGIEGETFWGAFTDLVGAVEKAHFATVEVLFAKRRAAKIVAPPRSSADTRLDRIRGLSDPSQKAEALATEMSHLIGTCPSLGKMFGSLASVPPDQKAEHLIASLPKALVDCKCAVDLPALSSTLFAILAPRDLERAIVAVRLSLAPSAKAPTLSLPRAMPWKDAAPKLAEALRKSPGGAPKLVAQ